MAEKGFGVKEVNLIGASGTPTITSPNNLNLNAVNVAISTNASIGGNLTVTGTVGIAGTLTYEDVTNIDAIGIVTARTGLKVLAGGANVVGVVTGTAFDGGIKVVAANSVAATVYPVFAGSGATQSGNLDLKTDNSLTYNSLSGELTAVKLTGNGSSLTNLPAANLTGTLPALDGSALTGIAVTEAPVTDYTVTANGSSAYRFHGGGVDETADNPDLYLIRGQKYRFNNTTGSSHPFAIREASGGSAYSNGVTGSQNGIQFFTVPYDAPASLFYQCTIHSGMVGNIYIRGAGGQNTNVGITTFSGMAFFRDDLTVSSSGLAVNIFESTDNHSRFRIKSGSSSLAQLEFADQDDADAGEIRYDHGNDIMTFHVGNNLEKLRITSGGDILIADTSNSVYNDTDGGGINLKANGQIVTKKEATSAADPLVWLNDTGQTTNKFIVFAQDGTEKANIGLAGNNLSLTVNGSERVRTTAAGFTKIGFINNANPTEPLNVVASAVNQDIARFTGANTNRGLLISTAANGGINDSDVIYDAVSTASKGKHTFKTDGTTRLHIDENGYLIKAAGRACAFNVRGSSNMSRTDTSGYICQFNDDTSTGCFDSGNNFNTSTYKFIAPVTGIYYFFTNIRLDQYSTGYIRTAFLSSNHGTGSTYYNRPETGHVISYPTNNNIMHISTSTVVQLDKDDELYVWQDPSADNSYTAYLAESSFGGYLIG